MINRMQEQDNRLEEYVDIEKLETLICIESLLDTCYQFLAGLVHNRTIREECHQLEQRVQHHQERLKEIFPISHKSEAAIEERVYKHLLQLKLPYLSLKEVINLAINLTTLKMDIYKHLSRTVQSHHELLNNFLEDTVEEMNFLRQEKKFHQNRVDNYLKI